jgi:hypothetical protein
MRRLRRLLPIALPIALMACASPAIAQDAAPDPQGPDKAPDKTIVVTGGRAEKERVRKLSRAITPYVSRDEAMPRFTDPICFVAAGLPRDYLVQIANRLAIDANEAGIRLAGDKCGPNVAVLFVDDGAKELGDLRKLYPRLFGDMDADDVRAAIAEPGPVHAWWVAQTVSSSGHKQNAIGVGGGASNVATLRVESASVLVLPTRSDVGFAVITLDRKALTGLSLTQIADYVAMRTLAGARPAQSGNDGTILGLFDTRGEALPEMSAFDRSYLKAVYDGQGNLRSSTKMNQVARSITHDAAKSDTAP